MKQEVRNQGQRFSGISVIFYHNFQEAIITKLLTKKFQKIGKWEMRKWE